MNAKKYFRKLFSALLIGMFVFTSSPVYPYSSDSVLLKKSEKKKSSRESITVVQKKFLAEETGESLNKRAVQDRNRTQNIRQKRIFRQERQWESAR
jgi:hypothetical protein